MLEIAIVEDEEKEALRLGSFLDRFSREMGVELRCSWSASAAAFLEDYRCGYDLIFMDIRMPDMDGMKAAQGLREMDSAVMLIFVTSLAQYAVQGYSVDALDYILKPVNYDGTLTMEQGLPLTTKADKRFRGFGMQSIKMLTEKYGGDLQIQAEGGIFRSSIMLPIREYVEKQDK